MSAITSRPQPLLPKLHTSARGSTDGASGSSIRASEDLPTPLPSSPTRPGYSRTFESSSYLSKTSDRESTVTDAGSLSRLISEGYSSIRRRSQIFGPPSSTRSAAEDAVAERTNRAAGARLVLSQGGGGGGAVEVYQGLPVYGQRGFVEGAVEILRMDEKIVGVEVKIEGNLSLIEIAEGGSSVSSLCLDSTALWSDENKDSHPCSSLLPFRLQLPAICIVASKEYTLPPSYKAHVSGIPGFKVSVQYTVQATLIKNSQSSFSRALPQVLQRSNNSVSIPFLYFPRNRPLEGLPDPLPRSAWGIDSVIPSWSTHDIIVHRRHSGGNDKAASQDLTCKFYFPTSRIFSMKKEIPFYLFFQGSPIALASFLPMMPSTNSKNSATQVQVVRQTNIDVRSITRYAKNKADMWRLDCIGTAKFKLVGDESGWVAYSGGILIDADMRVSGFVAPGLIVKDFVLLSCTPPDQAKSLYRDFRLMLPIHLATDSCAVSGVEGDQAQVSGSRVSSANEEIGVTS